MFSRPSQEVRDAADAAAGSGGTHTTYCHRFNV